MKWPHWNWLDRAALPALLAVMRFCWLWPWLDLLRQFLAPSASGPVLSPVLLIGMPLLSFAASQVVPLHELPPEKANAASRTTILWPARIGLALFGLLMLAVAFWWQTYRGSYGLLNFAWLHALGLDLIHWPPDEIPVAWLALFTLIYLWLRGLLDAAQPMSHDDVWGAISVGLVALVVHLLLATVTRLSLPLNLGNLVILFFAAAMLALAFSSLKITVGLDYALGLGQRRQARAPQTTRYWLFSVLVVVGGLLGLGVGLGLLVAPEQVARLLALINAALGAVWWLISWVLLAIGYVLFMIAYYIMLLLQPLLARLFSTLQELPLFELGEQPEATPMPEAPPMTAEAIPDPYRWIALAIFLVIVAVIFALVLRRLRASAAEPTDEVRESIFSADLLQDQLAKLWQNWFGRAQHSLATYFTLDGEAETRRRIRQAYQSLLTMTTQRGHGRRRDQTPREYRQHLAGQLRPEAQPSAGEFDAALQTITERYQRARYAPEPPSASEADSAQAAWTQVQQQLASDESAGPPTETKQSPQAS